MKRVLLLLMLVGVCVSASAQKSDKPTPVIFETDMGNDIDDAIALDLLFKNVDSGKIDLLGVGVHKNNPHSAEFIDIMRVWYGYDKMPIGVNEKWITDMECNDYCTKVCKLTSADGKPMFARSKNPQYEDAVKMYRRLLSKAEDNSVVIVTVGFSTTMAELLQSGPDKFSKLSGRDLVAKKVKYFSVMAGEFEMPKYTEYNVWNDLLAAKYFFDKSPAPMIITPFTLGKQVLYPAKSIENDFKWAEHHPMVEAYKAYDKMPYNRPSWDVIAAYYVCEHNEAAITLSQPGEVKVVDKGVTVFTPKADGRYRIIEASPEQRAMILEDFLKYVPKQPRNFKK
ncbi:MAG: nucleoside hydrolase [Alistipes sp.]|nr:nucleoside hydrolase [Alistipes sp.]